MRERIITGITVLALAGLSACSNPVQGAPIPTEATGESDSLPTRTLELPLDAIEPCSLLDADQRDSLGVGTGRPGAAEDGFGSRACIWSHFPEEPLDIYQVRTVVAQGAEVALDNVTGSSIISLDPFTAVETQSPFLRPDLHCVLIIDVAAGQHLAMRYEYDGSVVPMTRELACEKARNAAGMALQTLRTQVEG